ncbi:MAG: bacillithiol biosynthesis cysteine-adding enzyme BshC [Flavobacteriales bacterium]
MEVLRIPYSDTRTVAPLVQAYLNDDPALRGHYRHRPNDQGLHAAAQRTFDPSARQVLVEVLRDQYAGLPDTAAVQANIELLARPDALTITTGHQLVLFGGPLYVPFKVLNIIRLAREQSERLQRPVLPVFWMATEDHDRAEVDHTYFRGQRIQWPGTAGGAVGRLPLHGIEAAVEQAVQALGEGYNAAEYAALIRSCYRPDRTLAEAMRLLMHGLFGAQGLLILDGDDPRLKRLFIPVMREELLNQVAERTVRYANERLPKGYEGQAHARPINLFHLSPGHRRRIVEEDGRFRVLDGGPSWTADELLAELEARPADFSPNVLLRPVYQETVLPNMAYIGGAGELAYWLQLGWLFQALQVPMPAVLMRTSAAFLPAKRWRQWQELGLGSADLFADGAELRRRVAGRAVSFRTELAAERAELHAFYQRLQAVAVAADGTLRGAVDAREASAQQGLDRLERSLLRAARRQADDQLARLDVTLNAMAPGGTLQERRENILPLLAERGPRLLELLQQELDPLKSAFAVLVEE